MSWGPQRLHERPYNTLACFLSEQRRKGPWLTHRWIGRNYLPERHGQLCRVLTKSPGCRSADGKWRSSRACLIEFEDGYRARTEVALLRRLTSAGGVDA